MHPTTNFFLITVALGLLSANLAYGQVWQEWAARYNSPDSLEDYATCIDASAEGPIAVSGSSATEAARSDITTVMYNSSGIQMWADAFDGSAHDEDAANDLVVDEMLDDYQYVYVTGYQTGNQKDFVTLKYNFAGQRLWVRTYDGALHEDDEARAISAANSSNICVTGYSSETVGGADFTTIMYSQLGDLLWIAHYNGSGSGDDAATCLAIDNYGSVYVAGYSDGNTSPTATNYDFTVVKYNSSGQQQWVARYDTPGGGEDRPVKIALDGNGNVYVTGTTEQPATGADYLTLKIGTTGQVQWTAVYDGSAHGEDRAAALGVDPAGNVYITGQSHNGFDFDYLTLKYSTQGALLWQQPYTGQNAGDDYATSLTLDYFGNPYLTGASSGFNTDWDYATLSYDPSGNVNWVIRYSGLAAGADLAAELVMGSSNTVLVTGSSWTDSTLEDYATIKYNQSGPPMPVVLASFSASLGDDGVQLVWQTASEIDCYGWQVQRCQNGQPYQDISPLIPGYGTSTEPHDYGFTDESAQPGQSYSYRLKQIDLGGSLTFSDPLTASLPALTLDFKLLGIYPNPFNASVVASFELRVPSYVSFQVFNTAGKIVATLVDGWREAGEQQVTFDGIDLSSGVYLYRLEVGEQRASGKLVLLK